MKTLVLSELVILLTIAFQNKNAVYSDENTPTTEQTESSTKESESSVTPNNESTQNETNETSTGKLDKETQSTNEISNTTIVPPGRESTAIQNEADGSFIVRNYSEENDPRLQEEQKKEEREEFSRNVVNTENNSYKSARNIIASKSYNNSFVLTNLLNLSCDKEDAWSIGEPVDLTEFIVNLKFDSQSIRFDNKTTDFSNIHASGSTSFDPVHAYHNNFTCTSEHIGIVLDVIPENMTFEGDYIVHDNKTNERNNGTFLFKQTKARLSYKIPSISEYRNDGQDLKKYGDIIYANGQVKFTQLCDNQCDLLTTSAHMFNNVKSHILEKLKKSYISKPTDQFISAFPFLSICSPASTSSSQHKNNSTNHKYYVIDKIVVLGKNNSARLQLGPMILKGLANFTSGNVAAMKSHQPGAPKSFLISTHVNRIQGQCDWLYFKDNFHHFATNHSFGFIIEQIKFSISVSFSESWKMDNLKIQLDQISILRSDKNCPKILDFIKMMLQDFVRDTVTNSLAELFGQYFPELTSPATTSLISDSYTKKTRITQTRQVVTATLFHPSDKTDVQITQKIHDHLPFPTRKVLTPCKDTRKWWQKLFYRNKCKDRVHEDV